MATRCLARALLTTKHSLPSALSHSCTAATSSAVLPCSSSFLFRIRPLVAAASSSYFRRLVPAISTRAFSTRQTTTSLNDPNPNWSNRPPKETILLDGCDFEHWLVVVEKPEGDPTRDEIIDSYIKTLAMVVGSEEEARMKIYSVSTRHYFAFGALVSEELSYKLKELPKVRWVLPDSYLDVKNKDYGGEPFINGQAVPYDPKYHEEWVRNNARANERNRRNDRPRNFDRSRNFERRREMQGQNSGGAGGGPGGNYAGQAPPPGNAPNPGPNTGYRGGGPGGNYAGQAPPVNPGPNMGYGGGGPGGNYAGQAPPQNNYGGGMPPNYPANDGRPPMNGPGPNSYQSGPGVNQGGYPSPGQGQNQNYPGGVGQGSGSFAPNAGYGQNNMGPGPGQYQNGYPPNATGGQSQNIPGRDFPPSSNY